MHTINKFILWLTRKNQQIFIFDHNLLHRTFCVKKAAICGRIRILLNNFAQEYIEAHKGNRGTRWICLVCATRVSISYVTLLEHKWSHGSTIKQCRVIGKLDFQFFDGMHESEAVKTTRNIAYDHKMRTFRKALLLEMRNSVAKKAIKLS